MAVVELTSWHDLAACFGSAELFFESNDESVDQRETREAKAKAICAVCPVLAQCRADVDARPAKYGIYAGETSAERENRRRRARRRVRHSA